MERHLGSRQGQHLAVQLDGDSKLSIVDAQRAASGGRAGQPVLESHEYVLEDEWAHVRTSVINPKDQWKEAWDMCVLVFILYSAIVIPVRICFSAEAVGWVWDFEVGVSLFFMYRRGRPNPAAWQALWTARPRVPPRPA